MGQVTHYAASEPSRDEVDALREAVLVEFGAPWCEHCQAAQPLIAEAFAAHPDVRHLKIEDGRGRPLGRSFGVKLWPTFIFMRQGKEVARLVRPGDPRSIAEAFTLCASDAVL